MAELTYDVAIIGAGAVGCALARELSRYELSVLVLEAGDDVAAGATRANSGIVHGSYSAGPGTRKAALSLEGNRMFTHLSDELDFPFRRCGSLVLALAGSHIPILEKLLANGRVNGDENLEILSRDEVLRRNPRLNPETVQGALYCPGAGIVSPYEYAIALMENAIANGVRLHTGSPVTALSACGDSISLEAGGREYRARYVVNAAGSGSAAIAALAGPPPFAIRPRKGQYIIFRRGSALGLDTVVFQPPTADGKGILVTPTTWGNLLVGPDSQDVAAPDDLGTDPESLARIIRTARLSVKDFDLKQAIRVFSGTRPASDRGDFIVEWSAVLPGLLHLAGIESPGLTASPAIALEAVKLLRDSGLSLPEKPGFRPGRRSPVRPGALRSPADAARDANLSPGNPRRVICRCEQVTEASIRDALSRGIPVFSTDAVKRRTRAGMGACQGAFCTPRVKSLVAEITGADLESVAGPSRDRSIILADLDAMRKLLDE